jgi:hypothetical protein
MEANEASAASVLLKSLLQNRHLYRLRSAMSIAPVTPEVVAADAAGVQPLAHTHLRSQSCNVVSATYSSAHWQPSCPWRKPVHMLLRSSSPFARAAAAAAVLALLACAALAHQTRRTVVPSLALTRESGHVMHTAHFIPMRGSANGCEQFTAPEAVSTRQPLDFGADATARLNFVVNASGRVNGVVILGLSGQIDQQALVEAVIGWRFRPATCDGAPIDSEATLDLETSR